MILKPLSFIPAILMMYLIFSFSAQDGNVSGNLSYQVSEIIVETANEAFNRAEKELADQFGLRTPGHGRNSVLRLCGSRVQTLAQSGLKSLRVSFDGRSAAFLQTKQRIQRRILIIANLHLRLQGWRLPGLKQETCREKPILSWRFFTFFYYNSAANFARKSQGGPLRAKLAACGVRASGTCCARYSLIAC